VIQPIHGEDNSAMMVVNSERRSPGKSMYVIVREHIAYIVSFLRAVIQLREAIVPNPKPLCFLLFWGKPWPYQELKKL
jgi:hypothetical protein